jgi:hypothetical protein
MSWRSATPHRYGESLLMPGFQVRPFFSGQVRADNGFSIDNCLEWHTDPICFLSVKSCPGTQKTAIPLSIHVPEIL